MKLGRVGIDEKKINFLYQDIALSIILKIIYSIEIII